MNEPEDKPPRSRTPFVLPPPTLEELGVMPVHAAGTSFKIYRSVSLGLFMMLVGAVTAMFLWFEALGIFKIDPHQLLLSIPKNVQENTIVFDRNGEKIGEFFERYQLYVPYEQLPKGLVQAILAIEDRSFFAHSGIDPKAILRAAKESMSEQNFSQGASTITQQLVRNLFLSKEKSMARKVKEIAIAIRLDQILPKEKIFELYVNSLFLGFGAYGVGAAAERFFGRPLNELELHELALIAGLFQSPSNYNPHRFPDKARARQRQVLQAMFQARYLTREEASGWLQKDLNYQRYQPLNEIYAPHFNDYVREEARNLIGRRVEGSGLRIYTTLDVRLQAAAIAAFQESAEVFTEAESLLVPNYRKISKDEIPHIEAALVATDPRNGEILAMVGGRNYDESKYNRTIQSMRSPGSAFKPVVYSLALQNDKRWSDVMLVSPVSIEGYRPKNYKDEYLGETTLLRAFYQSLNTAAIELGAEMGLDAILEQARALGVRSPLKVEAGTMLGSSELTMLDLARVYGSFANAGRLVELSPIQKITDQQGKVLWEIAPVAQRRETAVTPQVAYLMTEGLRSVLQHGTAQRARHLAGLVVGKTGTSNDSVDNWFCGYSANMTAIAWLGNDQQLSLSGHATGGSLALPIWERFMKRALLLRRAEYFMRPAGVYAATINPKYGHRDESGVRAYFLSNGRPLERHSEFQKIEEKGTYRSLFAH